MSIPPFGPAGPSDFLANERTFLAYVRTALAVMAFGFVISRFSLFLRIMPTAALPSSTLSAFNSEHLGLAFAIFGCLLAFFGSWRFYATTRDLQKRQFYPAASGNIVVGIATTLLGVAVVLSLLRVF